MSTRTLSVRGLTEGAILAALVALFALAARYFPLIGIVSTFVTPLPLTVLVVRQGMRAGVLAALVASAIAGMIGGPLTGLAIALTFAPLGIAFGTVLRQQRPAPTVLVVGSVVSTASILINVAITLAISGINPYATLIHGMVQGQEEALRFYARLGLDEARMEQVAGPMRQILEIMPRLIPMLVVVGGVTTAYVNFEVTRFVLRRFRHPVPALPPLSSWRVPGLLLWALPLGIGLIWLAKAAPVPFDLPGETMRMLPPEDVSAVLYAAASRYPVMETAGLNLSIFTQVIFSMMGLVAAWVLLERYGAPRWLRWMAVTFAFTSPQLGIAVFFLGVADSAFDLRTRWRAARAAEASA